MQEMIAKINKRTNSMLWQQKIRNSWFIIQQTLREIVISEKSGFLPTLKFEITAKP